jgi:hypothetical protein
VVLIEYTVKGIGSQLWANGRWLTELFVCNERHWILACAHYCPEFFDIRFTDFARVNFFISLKKTFLWVYKDTGSRPAPG